MKEINVEEAASWSQEEADYNIMYLSQRAKDDEIARIRAIRGGEVDPEPVEVQAEVLEDEGNGMPDFAHMKADDVLDWVGDDTVRAGQAYSAEMERDKPRKGVVEELEALMEGDE